MERLRRGFHFDDVEVDLPAARILKAGQVVSVEPKAFKVLVFLLEAPGRLVEKRELLDAVWGGTYVTENALTRVIAQLRRALGDEAREAQYIETVPTLGYRFIAPVKVVEGDAPTRPAPAREARVSSRKLAYLMALGAVALFALVYASVRRPVDTRQALPSFRPKQITSSLGLDVHPTFSPDGSALAYSSDRSGSFEIYVRQLAAGGREIQLTTDGQQNLQPAWSPDGQHIAYHSLTRGGIWVVPALGGMARQVSDFGSRPAWAPDGGSLVFQSDPLTDLSPTAFGATPPSALWIAPASGEAAQPLTRPGKPQGGHGSPSWCPKGNWIAFTAGLKVWIVSGDGGSLRSVPHDGWAFDPAFAPDGKTLYFVGSKAGSLRLWRIAFSPETGEPAGAPQEMQPGSARHLTVSPDGRKLAYSWLHLTSNLWSLPLTQASGLPRGDPQPLTRDSSLRNTFPSFSADGRRIAFLARRVGASSDIWVADADGKNPQQLTTEPAEDYSPSWFPDGKRIAFLTTAEESKTVWSFALEDGRQQRVRDLDKGDASFRLSPDGKRVAFNAADEKTLNIWTAPLESGAPRQITFDPEMMGFPSWSPDSRLIAGEIKRGNDTHVAIVPAGGGPITQLTFEPGQSWPYGWSPDGEKIAFAGMRGGVWNVFWVSRRDKTQRQLTRNTRPNVYVRYPAWSPLGDPIVYEQAEITGNIWLLEWP